MNQGLTLLECVCLCNPCWCEDSDDYLFLSEEHDRDQGPFLCEDGELSGALSRFQDHETKEEEDLLVLGPNYDPMKAYYEAFHTIGEKVSNHVPSKLQFESIQKDLKKSQGKGYLSLNSHLMYFQLYVCSLPPTHPERMLLIKEYELYMNLFSPVSINTDSVSAKKYLKEARGKGRKGDRLLAYERAIYYTHMTTEKNLLIQEYCQFCSSLRGV